MQFRQESAQQQSQSQKIAPQLIQANLLLQCSNAELLQMIEQEQSENPALDEAEDVSDLEISLASQAPEDRRDSEGERTSLESRDFSPLEYDTKDTAASPTQDGDFDPLMSARAETTLAETLIRQLRAAAADATDIRIAEYLVDAVDERGYLQVDTDDACLQLTVPCGRLMEGIQRLQGCDPPGIGARDLRECLLLQIQHLRDSGESWDCVAERLLTDHWQALLQRRHKPLAHRLGVSAERIEKAVSFIQERLTPHPAAQFRQPWNHRPDTASATVRPDVIIRRGPTGFQVEVMGFENLTLHVNPHYRGLYEEIRAARAGSDRQTASRPSLTAEHQKHVIAYVDRASLFIKNIQQRQRTIQKIALALVENQQGFLETGQRRFLRPLTRTRLAETVGLHESTVSRALLHKFVQLPTQDVVSFDVFFEQAVGVKETIASLIADEDPAAPLSDQAVTDALTARGEHIARRTVVKYREELRIPASYLRRRH